MDINAISLELVYRVLDAPYSAGHRVFYYSDIVAEPPSKDFTARAVVVGVLPGGAVQSEGANLAYAGGFGGSASVEVRGASPADDQGVVHAARKQQGPSDVVSTIHSLNECRPRTTHGAIRSAV